MIYPTKKLGEVLEYEQPTKYLVNSTDYKDEYLTPVLTAGKSFVLGNTNEKDGIFPKEKLPVIIFDDFTTAIKFVDFPFKVKSSAMKILHAKKNIADISYLFYKMQTINFKPAQHKRYWISEYSNLKIPLPSLKIQNQIVKRLDKIAEAQKLNEGLIQGAEDLFQSLLHKEFDPTGKDWKTKRVKDILSREKYSVGKLKRREYQKFGTYPIIDQSINGIAGYSENKEVVYSGKLPLVIYGDHTRIIKFVDKPFILGADGTKILIPQDEVLASYLYFVLHLYNVAGQGYKRHFSLLKEIKIPVPPLKIQKQIAAKLSAVQDYKTQLFAQKSKLKELFDSILAKSLRGDL